MYIRKKEHRRIYNSVMLGIMIVVDVFLLAKAGVLIYEREVALTRRLEILDKTESGIVLNEPIKRKKVIVIGGE